VLETTHVCEKTVRPGSVGETAFSVGSGLAGRGLLAISAEFEKREPAGSELWLASPKRGRTGKDWADEVFRPLSPGTYIVATSALEDDCASKSSESAAPTTILRKQRAYICLIH
jgi:hypothetical protein